MAWAGRDGTGETWGNQEDEEDEHEEKEKGRCEGGKMRICGVVEIWSRNDAEEKKKK